MADQDTRPAVVIERRYDAPVAAVWAMWAEPEHFTAWYGPTGASVEAVEMDVRPGGRRHLRMDAETPGGVVRMWFVGEYVTVDPPNRLAYTESLSDEHGAVIDPATLGMPADHPEVTEVTVDLVADGDATVLTVTHAGVPADSPGAAGWAMALDALGARLASTARPS